MDEILGYLLTHIGLLAVLVVCVILLKAIIILTSKSGGLYGVIESFFKFYSRVEISLSRNKNETLYKISNNYLNVTIYALLVLILMLVLISKDLPN